MIFTTGGGLEQNSKVPEGNSMGREVPKGSGIERQLI